MFKRRNPKTYVQMATEMVYPRGGWRRAGTYVVHRLRRLPDQPQKIGRGTAAGMFVSFTPFFGFHFLSAAAVAWIIRGNILAALLGTFLGNPLTTPFIALTSVTLGRWMLGVEGALSPGGIFRAFARASEDLTHNITSIFTSQEAHWDGLYLFFHDIFLPYLVGGLIPGLIASVIVYYVTVPVIRAYHRRRAKLMAARIAKLRDEGALRTRAVPVEPAPLEGIATSDQDPPEETAPKKD
ncbi:DUF2062 domain-containing protein [Paracoccus pacificus]|uniref:DUF2062 domain-containing protein n=1 Tax=Paracoccus pacificus TaxID=1463598 RepID=UPI003A8D8774